MHRQSFAALLVAALLGWGCSDSVSPERRGAPVPTMAAAAGTGIVLDQHNASMGTATPMGSGTHIGDGFIPTNPHHGDAIVATFFWRGSTNVITTVTDHLADGTPVGNTYTLVEYVTSGGMSMATYVATNVQNFPDPRTDDNGVLDVHAITSSPVTGDGIILTAYSGVAAGIGEALGSHRSAAGSGSSPTTADPGAIPVDADALVYGVTLSNGVTGIDRPVGFTNITTISDASTEADAEYAVQASAGSVDPVWTWYFSAPSTWLASAVTLRPAAARLTFTVQPGNTAPFMTITPPVQVTALDAAGNPVTSFSGPVSVAIGHNAGMLMPGNLSGTKTQVAANGVATFSDLSIDQLGNGYTLTATASGLAGTESAAFNISIGPF